MKQVYKSIFFDTLRGLLRPVLCVKNMLGSLFQSLPKSAPYQTKRLALFTENGTDKCIGCKMCAATCPTKAISIETHVPLEASPYLYKFEIDRSKCIECGLCVSVCPVDALGFVDAEMQGYMGPSDFILSKEQLYHETKAEQEKS